MRIIVSNLVFFCVLGFFADMVNFAGTQAEILKATFVFSATEMQLGILGACCNLFYAIPTLFTGVMSEKVGRKPLVLASLVCLTASYIWGGWAHGIRELYGVATLRAVGTALLWPPVMAWMARAVPPEKFSRFLGIYNVSWAAGTFIGFWGAGYLFQKMGHSSPFYVAAALAVALLLFVMILRPSGGSGIALPADVLTESHNDHLSVSQKKYFIRQGLLMVGAGSVAINAGLYLFPKVGEGVLTEVQISLLNSMRILGQMTAFFLMGSFGVWHFKKWPVWTTTALLVSGLCILATTATYVGFIIGFLIIGLGFGAGFSMCAYYALGLSESKGRASGMMETTIGLGGFTGPLVGGAVAMASSPRIGIVSGTAAVVICAIASIKGVGIKKDVQSVGE